MFGPSGFFETIENGTFPDTFNELEILYDSEFGFNTLYRGSKNGRFFVYKALKPEFRGNPFYEDLLRKDFNIGFRLSHSAICQYYALVSLPGIGNCIVMDWIDGCNLEELISKGKVPTEKARKIICEICDALSYMHMKQIVHRDLKPENILITFNGSNVKIIDFGLSDEDSYNLYKGPAGTKMYASPELLAGEHIDGRSDIWSLGIIIRELSSYYNHIASKCLKRVPENRYQNASEVKQAILKEGKRKFMARLSFAAGFILFLTIGYNIYINSAEKLIGKEADKMPTPEPKEETIVKNQTDSPIIEKTVTPNDVTVTEPAKNKSLADPTHTIIETQIAESADTLATEKIDSNIRHEMLDKESLDELFNAAVKEL